MAFEIVMPQLGLSMDSGQIIEWLKKPGDEVQAGDLLLVVESDKSAVEIEAVESGILHILLGPQDGPVPVGEVIAYLMAQGEQPPAAGLSMPAEIQSIEENPSLQSSQTIKEAVSTGNGKRLETDRLPSTPAARRRAVELGVNWRQAKPSGLRGQIRERDVLALAASLDEAAAKAAVTQISPVARRLAESTGFDIARLARQHPGKRLERSDIEEAIRAALLESSTAPASSMDKPLDRTDSHRSPAGSLRRLIAERMLKSAHTTAPVTLTTEADASELVRMRSGLISDPKSEIVPSYNVLIACLTARALLEHPALNASIDGGEIIYWDTVNIGIAVETERGLVVPVLRDVQEKPVHQLAVEADDLLTRASQGKALPDELTGSTFTITNLGSFEIDAFTPIINLPECGVLGVGRLVKRVVPVEDQAAIRTMVSLSLTFDHRLVDGAPAARFLQRIKQFVELPYLWLV
jgi:pyruvate dehydrogenase E2 component (dihydrolipoamide acetyltransferase)